MHKTPLKDYSVYVNSPSLWKLLQREEKNTIWAQTFESDKKHPLSSLIMRLGVSPVQLVAGADIIIKFWVDGLAYRRVEGRGGLTTDFTLHFLIIHIHTGVTDVANCNG